jgi:hypothetical protein
VKRVEDREILLETPIYSVSPGREENILQSKIIAAEKLRLGKIQNQKSKIPMRSDRGK